MPNVIKLPIEQIKSILKVTELDMFPEAKVPITVIG